MYLFIYLNKHKLYINIIMNYLLVDISYLIFYRYFALLQWWKLAKPDNELPEDPYTCKEFVEKFEKMMLESLTTIKKKLKIHKQECKVFAARDCPRTEIWRNKLYPTYKEERYKDDAFMGGSFFKHVYNNDILTKAGFDNILKYSTMEADDIAAILKIKIREKYPDEKIYIITNDHDYLQLMDDNTELINLKFKNLKDNKKVFPEADKNLFYKIILGDKSDCISPVFKKCGIKTVEKNYNNKEELEKALTKENVMEKFNLNKKLVSFCEIPDDLVCGLIKKYIDIFTNL